MRPKPMESKPMEPGGDTTQLEPAASPAITTASRCYNSRSVGCGPVAQLGARFHGMEEVKGSNPFRSTKAFQPGRRRNTHWPPIMLTVADAQASARETSLRVLLCGAFLATLLV